MKKFNYLFYYTLLFLFLFKVLAFSMDKGNGKKIDFYNKERQDPAFSIKLDEENKKIKVNDIGNYYLDYDNGYEDVIFIILCDKYNTLKSEVTLVGYSINNYRDVSALNNISYEEKDYFKVTLFRKNIRIKPESYNGIISKNTYQHEKYRYYILNDEFYVIKEAPPKITGAENIEIELDSDFDPMKNVNGYSIILNEDITKKIVVRGNVNTKKLGEYTIHYKLVDTTGHWLNKYRKVKVIPKKVIPKRNTENTVHIFNTKNNFKDYKEKDNYFKIVF